jgi:mRNA interferase RelE/StbE
VKFGIDKSFARDIDRIKDERVLSRLRTLISTIQDADTLREIPHVKKIEGYETYYRIKLGDYRLGLEAISGREVVLIRFLHRKDIYRYFPKRG